MNTKDKKYILKQIDEIRKILSWNWKEKDLLIDEFINRILKRIKNDKT